MIPAGHPLTEQIIVKAGKGEVTIEPAVEIGTKDPIDAPITAEDVLRALEYHGILTREQVLAERRGK